jgi:hypothetical protein
MMLMLLILSLSLSAADDVDDRHIVQFGSSIVLTGLSRE